MPFIVVKGDKHLWDCIAQKITGDITSCVCACVCLSIAVYACVREGLTAEECDMLTAHGGVKVRD